MVKCGVLFEVRTQFLNITYTSFGFKGLMTRYSKMLYSSSSAVIGELLEMFLMYEKRLNEATSGIFRCRFKLGGMQGKKGVQEM
jgi:hypothetical protein